MLLSFSKTDKPSIVPDPQHCALSLPFGIESLAYRIIIAIEYRTFLEVSPNLSQAGSSPAGRYLDHCLCWYLVVFLHIFMFCAGPLQLVWSCISSAQLQHPHRLSSLRNISFSPLFLLVCAGLAPCWLLNSLIFSSRHKLLRSLHTSESLAFGCCHCDVALFSVNQDWAVQVQTKILVVDNFHLSCLLSLNYKLNTCPVCNVVALLQSLILHIDQDCFCLWNLFAVYKILLHSFALPWLFSIQCYCQTSPECAAASVQTCLQCSLDELVEKFHSDELQDSAYSYEGVYLLAILCASEDLDAKVWVDKLCSKL